MPFSNHGDLHAGRQVLRERAKRETRAGFGQRDFGHVKALRLRRELRLHTLRHEVEAENRADHAEGIGDGITDGGIGVCLVEGRLQGRRAGHRAGKQTERVTDLHIEHFAKSQCDEKRYGNPNQRK